jgi:hypothetical protein
MNPLQELTVLDPQEQTIHVASLWSEQPVVLVFVRHFG